MRRANGFGRALGMVLHRPCLSLRSTGGTLGGHPIEVLLSLVGLDGVDSAGGWLSYSLKVSEILALTVSELVSRYNWV